MGVGGMPMFHYFFLSKDPQLSVLLCSISHVFRLVGVLVRSVDYLNEHCSTRTTPVSFPPSSRVVLRTTREVRLAQLEACLFNNEESQHGGANKVRRPASA